MSMQGEGETPQSLEDSTVKYKSLDPTDHSRKFATGPGAWVDNVGLLYDDLHLMIKTYSDEKEMELPRPALLSLRAILAKLQLWGEDINVSFIDLCLYNHRALKQRVFSLILEFGRMLIAAGIKPSAPGIQANEGLVPFLNMAQQASRNVIALLARNSSEPGEDGGTSDEEETDNEDPDALDEIYHHLDFLLELTPTIKRCCEKPDYKPKRRLRDSKTKVEHDGRRSRTDLSDQASAQRSSPLFPDLRSLDKESMPLSGALRAPQTPDMVADNSFEHSTPEKQPTSDQKILDDYFQFDFGFISPDATGYRNDRIRSSKTQLEPARACNHCLRRKLRCLPSKGDDVRCANCVRINKICESQEQSKRPSGPSVTSSVSSHTHAEVRAVWICVSIPHQEILAGCVKCEELHHWLRFDNAVEHLHQYHQLSHSNDPYPKGANLGAETGLPTYPDKQSTTNHHKSATDSRSATSTAFQTKEKLSTSAASASRTQAEYQHNFHVGIPSAYENIPVYQASQSIDSPGPGVDTHVTPNQSEDQVSNNSKIEECIKCVWVYANGRPVLVNDQVYWNQNLYPDVEPLKVEDKHWIQVAADLVDEQILHKMDYKYYRSDGYYMFWRYSGAEEKAAFLNAKERIRQELSRASSSVGKRHEQITRSKSSSQSVQAPIGAPAATPTEIGKEDAAIDPCKTPPPLTKNDYFAPAIRGHDPVRDDISYITRAKVGQGYYKHDDKQERKSKLKNLVKGRQSGRAARSDESSACFQASTTFDGGSVKDDGKAEGECKSDAP